MFSFASFVYINFTKINTPPWVFFTFLNCTNGTKSRNAPHLPNRKYTRNAEKHEQVAIKYLKAKILNDAKQQFSSSDQGDKINAASVKSLREKNTIEKLQCEICFFTRRNERKNTLYKMIIHFIGSPKKNDFLFPYLETIVRMLRKRHLSTNKTCQNHLKNNRPIIVTETQAKIIT